MNITDPVQRLRARAAANNVPMKEICRIAGVAASTPSRWSSGTFEPKLKTLRKLEQALEQIEEHRSSSEECDGLREVA